MSTEYQMKLWKRDMMDGNMIFLLSSTHMEKLVETDINWVFVQYFTTAEGICPLNKCSTSNGRIH